MSTTMSTIKPRVRKSPGERSAEIVDAAIAIAREHGLSAVTLRAVAARAEVASGLVPHYEPSIDQLVARVFREIVGAELAELVAEIGQIHNPVEQMRNLIVTLLGGGREEVTLIWVEAYALGRRNGALAAAIHTETQAWTNFVTRIIRAGTEAGQFQVAKPADTAWQLIGMIDGLNAQALVRRTDALHYVAQMARASEVLLGAKTGALTGE